MAVGQVDDVGDGRQHGSLAAGANDGVSFTHCKQQLTNVQTHTNTKVLEYLRVNNLNI